MKRGREEEGREGGREEERESSLTACIYSIVDITRHKHSWLSSKLLTQTKAKTKTSVFNLTNRYMYMCNFKHTQNVYTEHMYMDIVYPPMLCAVQFLDSCDHAIYCNGICTSNDRGSR